MIDGRALIDEAVVSAAQSTVPDAGEREVAEAAARHISDACAGDSDAIQAVLAELLVERVQEWVRYNRARVRGTTIPTSGRWHRFACVAQFEIPYVLGKRRVLFGDMTPEDHEEYAALQRERGMRLLGVAEYHERLATAMRRLGVQRTRDLPPEFFESSEEEE
jgi:hypothetical protein